VFGGQLDGDSVTRMFLLFMNIGVSECKVTRCVIIPNCQQSSDVTILHSLRFAGFYRLIMSLTGLAFPKHSFRVYVLLIGPSTVCHRCLCRDLAAPEPLRSSFHCRSCEVVCQSAKVCALVLLHFLLEHTRYKNTDSDCCS
jgi:hypothetical protein